MVNSPTIQDVSLKIDNNQAKAGNNKTSAPNGEFDNVMTKVSASKEVTKDAQMAKAEQPHQPVKTPSKSEIKNNTAQNNVEETESEAIEKEFKAENHSINEEFIIAFQMTHFQSNQGGGFSFEYQTLTPNTHPNLFFEAKQAIQGFGFEGQNDMAGLNNLFQKLGFQSFGQQGFQPQQAQINFDDPLENIRALMDQYQTAIKADLNGLANKAPKVDYSFLNNALENGLQQFSTRQDVTVYIQQVTNNANSINADQFMIDPKLGEINVTTSDIAEQSIVIKKPAQGNGFQQKLSFDQSPAEQIRMQMSKLNPVTGTQNIRLQLKPQFLGGVDVKIEFKDDQIAKAVFVVEKQETLEWLSRDTKVLEQSLKDAGLKLSSNQMQFEFQNQQQAFHQEAQANFMAANDEFDAEDTISARQALDDYEIQLQFIDEGRLNVQI